MATQRQPRTRIPTPGFRPLAHDKARRYVNTATGEIVSRRKAEGLTARGYGAGRLVKGWRTIGYKSLRGVMGRIGRLPNGVNVFIVAHGELLRDSGDETAGQMAWKTIVPVARSETVKTFTKEDIEERAADVFVSGTIDAWAVRWR